MDNKELKLILLDVVDLFVEIIDCSGVYSQGKSKKVQRLIDKIGNLKIKE